MSKSQFVEGLDAIQAEVDSFLKPLGFQKKGRTHNRLTKGGLTHVVNFQKEKFAGQRPTFRLFKKKSYGQFAVNLGVFLPCVYQVEQQCSPEEFVEEQQCEMRQRLSMVAFKKDKWFEVTDDASDLAITIVDLFQHFGLVFLNQFQTYEDVLSYYTKHGNLPLQTLGRANLAASLIAHHLGNGALAKSLFQRAHTTHHEGFQKHVEELAKRVGYTVK
jgi:hypothetical protein